MRHAPRIQKKLRINGNSQIATDQQKYFKYVLDHHGIKAPELNSIFKEVYADLKALTLPEKFELSETLLKSTYMEEKLFGIKILSSNHKEIKLKDFKTIETFFDKNYIYDWGTCDTLCGSVLHELVKAQNKDIISCIHNWRLSKNLWQQRASCVTFVKTARFGTNKKEIIDICTSCVKSPERFVQLGNGILIFFGQSLGLNTHDIRWVLRELSLFDLDLVVKFIKDNYHHFSREGLRYAIEKMSNEMKKSLLAYKPLANNETEDESNESDEFEDEPKPIPKNRRKKIAVASEKSTKEEIAPKKRSNPATTPKNVKRVKKDINID